MTLRFCGLLLPLLLIVSGCGHDDQPAPQTTKKDAGAQTVESGASVTTTVATIAEVEEVIASQNGKVVVLDLWALW